jgi:hypothetical protein
MFPKLSYYRNPRRKYNIKVMVGGICNGISKEKSNTMSAAYVHVMPCIIVEQVK